MMGRIERAQARIKEQTERVETDAAEAQTLAVLASKLAEQQKLEALQDHPNYQKLLQYAQSDSVRNMLKEIWDYTYKPPFLSSEKSIFGIRKKKDQRPFEVIITHVGDRYSVGTPWDLTVGFTYDAVTSYRQIHYVSSYEVTVSLDEKNNIVLALDSPHGVTPGTDFGWEEASRKIFSDPESFLEAYALDHIS